MNRRDFLGAMTALGISISTPVVFGSHTSNHNIEINYIEEQPIKINITTKFNLEQVFEHGQLRTYEELEQVNTIVELTYKNRTEKYKAKDKIWICNRKPPLGTRRLPENNNTIYLLKTKDVFSLYAKNNNQWWCCEITIGEKIDTKT